MGMQASHHQLELVAGRNGDDRRNENGRLPYHWDGAATRDAGE